MGSRYSGNNERVGTSAWLRAGYCVSAAAAVGMVAGVLDFVYRGGEDVTNAISPHSDISESSSPFPQPLPTLGSIAVNPTFEMPSLEEQAQDASQQPSPTPRQRHTPSALPTPSASTHVIIPSPTRLPKPTPSESPSPCPTTSSRPTASASPSVQVYPESQSVSPDPNDLPNTTISHDPSTDPEAHDLVHCLPRPQPSLTPSATITPAIS